MTKLLTTLTALLTLTTPGLAAPLAYNDPLAALLAPDEAWTTEAGAMGILHVLVTVPGPGDFDLGLQLPPDIACPPKEVIKRKLPRRLWADATTPSITPIHASIQSLGWHPVDGFTRVRMTVWGATAQQYHVAVYYCLPSGHGRH